MSRRCFFSISEMETEGIDARNDQGKSRSSDACSGFGGVFDATLLISRDLKDVES